MRRVLILVGLILLLGSLTFSAAAQQPDAILVANAGQTAALQGDEQPPVPPDDDGETAEGLLAGVRDLLGQVISVLQGDDETENTAVDAYPVEEVPTEGVPVEEVPVEQLPIEEPPLEETPVEEGVSQARQQADALIAKAQKAFEDLSLDLTGSVPDIEEQETAEETAASLLSQAQQMFAQIAAEATAEASGEEQTAVQNWMPSMPDCGAPPAPMVNWSGCDKSGIVLDGANLEGAILVETDFSGAQISHTDMSGAIMKMADFSGAELYSVLMRESVLYGADFTDSLLLFVDLSDADASKAVFSGADVLAVLALNAKLVGADFSNTLFIFSDFSLADLSWADFGTSELAFNFFRDSNPEGANFELSELYAIDMAGANVQNVDFSGTVILGIWFKNTSGEPAAGSADVDATHYICPDGAFFAAQMITDAPSLCDWSASPSIPPAPSDIVDCNAAPAPGVNWSGCDKTALTGRGLDLRNANLQGTFLTGVNMIMWDLSGADLSNAFLPEGLTTLSSLRGANLSGAILEDRRIDNSDLSSADFDQANLGGVFITFATARESNLNEATLIASDIQLADFSHADFKDVDGFAMFQAYNRLRGANLSGADMEGAVEEIADMSAAQIEGLDLSSNQLADSLNVPGSVWLKYANGVPTSSADLTLDGTLICPAGNAVFGPLTTDAASLCDWAECVELVEDGDFETQSGAWYLPATEYTAEYSQEQANSPVWSVRTGIVEPEDNTYSFSSARQKVTLPAGMSNAVLSFYLYPQTDEPMNYLIPDSMEQALSIKGATSAMGPHGSHIGDAQWVIIYDDWGREVMRPISMRSNSQTWELHEVDLGELVHPYKDVTIELYFGTFNNGYEGVTAMYVDDVSLGNCTGIPQPPPPEPPPVVCADTVVNGGFEVQDNSWLLPITPMPAGYNDQLFNSGAWSMRTGIDDPEVNVKSFSSAIQRVTIPADATAADLTFYLNQHSTEDHTMLIPENIETVLAPTAMKMNYGDAQWVLILNEKMQQLERLVSTRSNEQQWREYEFDLLAYRGKTILLYFGTFNNGWDGRTAMFVDDVTLDVCTPEVN